MMLRFAGRARALTGLILLAAANVGCSDETKSNPGGSGTSDSGGSAGGGVSGGGGAQNVAGDGTAGAEAEVQYSPGEVRWIYPLPETVRPISLVGTANGVLAAGDDATPLEGTPWFIELDQAGERAREVRLSAKGPGIWDVGVHADGAVSLVGALQSRSYSVSGQMIPDGGSYVASIAPGASVSRWVKAIDTGDPTNPYVSTAVGGGETVVTGEATGAVSIDGISEGESCAKKDFGSHAALFGPDGTLRWLKVYCTGTTIDTVVVHADKSTTLLIDKRAGEATDELPLGMTLMTVDAAGEELSRTTLLSGATPDTFGSKGFALDGNKVGLVIRSQTAVTIGPLTVPAAGDGLLVVGADGELESGITLPAGLEDVARHPSGDWIAAGKASDLEKYVVRLKMDGTVVWRREMAVTEPLAFHTYRALEIGVATDTTGDIYFRLATSKFDTYAQENRPKRLSDDGFWDLIGAIEP